MLVVSYDVLGRSVRGYGEESREWCAFEVESEKKRRAQNKFALSKFTIMSTLYVATYII